MKLTPEELRGIYVRGTARGPSDHAAVEELARLLSGDVSPDERERLAEHVGRCSRCAEDLRVASGMERLAAREAVSSRRFAWRRGAGLLAAAAVLLVAGGLTLLRLRLPAPDGTAFRASEGTSLRSLLDADGRIPRTAPVLRWAGGPAGATFDILLANERLDVLAKIPDVRGREVRVPAAVLSAIPRGGKLVWKVTAVQPDGSRTDSATFVNPVE